MSLLVRASFWLQRMRVVTGDGAFDFFGQNINVGTAPLVQLDRMSAYGADGRRFESCTGCFLFWDSLNSYPMVNVYCLNSFEGQHILYSLGG